MKSVLLVSAMILNSFSLSLAQGNSKVCFPDRKEMAIPNTKYNLTSRGEISSNGQKIGGLALPKGFVADCVVTATVKSDSLFILSLKAVDYDDKSAFVFRISTKDSKIMWSQTLKNQVEPAAPFSNDKIIVIPALNEAIALNPDTGSVRWKYTSREPDGVLFKKLNLQGNVLQVEGVKVNTTDTTPVKVDIYIADGRPVPPKKDPKAN